MAEIIFQKKQKYDFSEEHRLILSRFNTIWKENFFLSTIFKFFFPSVPIQKCQFLWHQRRHMSTRNVTWYSQTAITSSSPLSSSHPPSLSSSSSSTSLSPSPQALRHVVDLGYQYSVRPPLPITGHCMPTSYFFTFRSSPSSSVNLLCSFPLFLIPSVLVVTIFFGIPSLLSLLTCPSYHNLRDVIYIYIYVYVLQWSTGYWCAVAFHRSCPFIAPSDVKFFCFIALSISFSHFISCRPRRRLPPVTMSLFAQATIFSHFFRLQ